MTNLDDYELPRRTLGDAWNGFLQVNGRRVFLGLVLATEVAIGFLLALILGQ